MWISVFDYPYDFLLLAGVPCVMVLTFGVADVVELWDTGKRRGSGWLMFDWWVLVVSLGISFMQFIQLILAATTDSLPDLLPYDIASGVCWALTWPISLIIYIWQRGRRGEFAPTPWYFFAFWFLSFTSLTFELVDHVYDRATIVGDPLKVILLENAALWDCAEILLVLSLVLRELFILMGVRCCAPQSGPEALLMARAGGAVPSLEEQKDQEEEEEEDEVGPENLELKAGCLTRALYCFIVPLIWKGANSPLEKKDVGRIYPDDEADRNYSAFMVEWEKELLKNKPQLYRAVRRSLMKEWWKGMIAYLLHSVLMFVPALILPELVNYLQGVSDLNRDQVWILVAAMFIVPFAGSLCYNWHNHFVLRIGLHAKSAMAMAVYSKAIKLSAAARSSTSVGNIVNIMSTDAQALQDVMLSLNGLWASPLQLIFALVLLYQQIANSMFVAFGFLFMLGPLNFFVFKYLIQLWRQMLNVSDSRVKLVNEILAGIKVFKMYSWEVPFRVRVQEIRNEQLRLLFKVAVLIAVGFLFVLIAAPMLMPVVVFTVFTAVGGYLTPATAYTALLLFNLVRIPFTFFPMILQQVVGVKVSLDRLQKFFELGEIPADTLNRPQPLHANNAIEVEDGEFDWGDPSEVQNFKWGGMRGPPPKKGGSKPGDKKEQDEPQKPGFAVRQDSYMGGNKAGGYQAAAEQEEKERFMLRNVQLQIKKGQLVAIVGTVGNGKTSLISAMLADMIKTKGVVRVAGKVSFAAQVPWIINETVRKNITYGTERLNLDRERYNKVLDVCALRADLQLLPKGEWTAIGERGINISGGQRARISLARALYAENEIYMLDDVLSAVDQHVGEYIWREAICKFLAGKTRIVVMNQLQYLSQVDHIIMVDRGRILEQGSYQQLCQEGTALSRTMKTLNVAQKSERAQQQGEGEGEGKEQDGKPEEKKQEKKDKFMTEEERGKGEVAWSIYHYYFSSAGWFSVLFMLLFYVAVEVCQVGGALLLADWAAASASDKVNRYILLYLAWGLGSASAVLLRSVIFAFVRVRAARTIHNQLYDSVMRAPLSFFDKTPLGRILNRFSADIDKLDQGFPRTFAQASSSLFSILGSLVLILYTTQGWFAIIFIPVILLYYRLQKNFRRSTIELQRLESLSRSPVYAQFSETIVGVGTIRAFGFVDLFKARNMFLLDTNARIFFNLKIVQNWMALCLDVIGGLLTCSVAILAVLQQDILPPQLLGLALLYSFNLGGLLKQNVTFFAEMEVQMNSLERLKYYSSEIPQENTTGLPAAESWPHHGKIEVKNLSCAYKKGLPILKDVSFSVQPGEKIGIVGRTGSGKSTFMLCMLRLIDHLEGQIVIDGEDTQRLPLSQLRGKLGIIPQDPVMFADTLRRNLDPTDSHSSKEIWDCLELVQLAAYVKTLPGGLSEQVAEGGNNFSVGQRQLICIVRALLRKPKLLLLDEATANIDSETDKNLQRVIRTYFKEATVLTIAHRLETIMDSDKVLLFENGRLIEFDTPEHLLQRDEGAFQSMVSAHGEEYAKRLKALVKQKGMHIDHVQTNGHHSNF